MLKATPINKCNSKILSYAQNYTSQEIEEQKKLYMSHISCSLVEDQVVKGYVIGISGRDAIIGINAKADGLVSLNEFRDLLDLKPDDEVEVYIEQKEDSKGQLCISRKKAKIFRGWEELQKTADEGTAVEGLVQRRTKGGLIVDIFGIETFLPGSQIDFRPVKDFDSYIGKTIEVGVVKINHTNDNVIVSHKMLIQKNLESQKSDIIANLEKGQILEGIIKNLTNFGAFVDLGGVDGLLHITDISWGRVSHPENELEVGEQVKVVVTDFDEDKKRISLGMKQLLPHPWESLPSDVEVGSKLKGKVANITDYGAFVEVLPGVEGLVHVSELSWSQYQRKIISMLSVGDEIETMVLTLDRENKKMSLGVKHLKENPWTSNVIGTKYAPGTRHSGIVRNLTNFGAFVEIEEGLDGLLHIGDLSWENKVSHPSEILKIGDKIDVVVLEINVSNKRLSLGIKQLEKNPWDVFEELFPENSIHTCEVVRMTERGAWVLLSDNKVNIEGYIPQRHTFKENGEKISVGEKLPFKVLSISKSNKKILLSHTDTFTTVNTEVKGGGSKNIRKYTRVKGPVHHISTEKSTLGDLEVLANLKNKVSREES